MDREKINQELVSLIQAAMPEIDGDVSLSASIVSEYGVNSVSIIRLIVAIESKFGVSFSDYELDLAGYDSFSDLAAVIEKKLEDK